MADPIDEVLAAQQRVAAQGLVHAAAVADRLGLTGTDVKCLLIVVGRPSTPRELAAQLRLTPSAVTAVIDRLVAAGFARREPSTTDRRRTLVHPVPAAAERAVALYRPLHRQMRALLAGYDPTQLALLSELAERSAEILRRQTERLNRGSP